MLDALYMRSRNHSWTNGCLRNNVRRRYHILLHTIHIIVTSQEFTIRSIIPYTACKTVQIANTYIQTLPGFLPRKQVGIIQRYTYYCIDITAVILPISNQPVNRIGIFLFVCIILCQRVIGMHNRYTCVNRYFNNFFLLKGHLLASFPQKSHQSLLINRTSNIRRRLVEFCHMSIKILHSFFHR